MERVPAKSIEPANRLRAEGTAALWRARYWLARAAFLAGAFVVLLGGLALASAGALGVATQEILPERLASIGGAMAAIVCFLATGGILWSVWCAAKRVRADGVATPEKAALEAQIAKLRGEVRAQKEAELLRVEIGAAPCSDASAGETLRRLPKSV
jgi:hypothetical protein